jgi:hypothetical protein
VWFTRFAGNTQVCLRLGVARIKRLNHVDGDCRAIRSSRKAAPNAGLMLSGHQRDLALRSVLFSERACRRAFPSPSLMLAAPICDES